jgi:hypothetical protein
VLALGLELAPVPGLAPVLALELALVPVPDSQ